MVLLKCYLYNVCKLKLGKEIDIRRVFNICGMVRARAKKVMCVCPKRLICVYHMIIIVLFATQHCMAPWLISIFEEVTSKMWSVHSEKFLIHFPKICGKWAVAYESYFFFLILLRNKSILTL